MLCRKPYMRGKLPFGCGSCLPCRINQRRVWSHRIMLESFKHTSSLFITLTYDPNHLPLFGSLDPTHVQLWIKRIRKAYHSKLRYFLVGEYGDESQRPHYHLALFGYEQPLCQFCSHQFRRKGCDCLASKTWGKGNVLVGQVTKDSACYIAGYVTKKITASRSDFDLGGRHPEFSRMSLRPGIGAHAMVDVAHALNSMSGMQEVIDVGDVPSTLTHAKKKHPLGRYLQSCLRKELGLNEELLKQQRLTRWSLEMDEVYANLTIPDSNFKKIYRRDHLVADSTQGAKNQASTFKLFTQKRRSL